MFLLSNINVFLIMYYCGIVIGHTSPSDRWGMSKWLVSIAFVHIPLEQPVKIGKGRLAGLLLCSASSQRYNWSANGTTRSIIEGYSVAAPSSWRECFNSQSAFAVVMPKLPWWVLYWDYLHPAPFKSLGCSTGLTSKYVMSLSDIFIYKSLESRS